MQLLREEFVSDPQSALRAYLSRFRKKETVLSPLTVASTHLKGSDEQSLSLLASMVISLSKINPNACDVLLFYFERCALVMKKRPDHDVVQIFLTSATPKEKRSVEILLQILELPHLLYNSSQLRLHHLLQIQRNR